MIHLNCPECHEEIELTPNLEAMPETLACLKCHVPLKVLARVELVYLDYTFKPAPATTFPTMPEAEGRLSE